MAGKLRSLAGESPLPSPAPDPGPSASAAWARRSGPAPQRRRRVGASSPRSWGPGRVGRGGGAPGSEEALRGRGRARTQAPGSGPPRGRRGGARRGLISSSAGTARREPARSKAAPAARVHAAPPATAARVWALGPAPRRPAARAAAAAARPARSSGGTRGGRGTGGLPRAPGRGVPERTPAAGGARGAALLQLPCGLAQRPASAGRRAGGPRHGECPGDTAAQRVGRTPVRARPSAPRSTTLGEMGPGPRRLRSGQAVRRPLVAQSPQGAGGLVRRF